MPIRAVHLSRKMDIVQLFQRLYTDRFKVSHYLHKDSIVLKLRTSNESSRRHHVPPHLDQDTTASAKTTTSSKQTADEKKLGSLRSVDRWVVYFDYGAVVFFNCSTELTERLINHVKSFCTDVFEMRGHDEELMLIADPQMTSWSNLSDNSIRV